MNASHCIVIGMVLVSVAVRPTCATFVNGLYCHRLVPSAATSVITPCRFPCALNYQENSYSIALGYEPDGTPCPVGRCRGGACLDLRHYFMLESFRQGFSSRSRLYTNRESAESDEHLRNAPVVTSGRYARIHVFREASSNMHSGHVPSDSGNPNSGTGFPMSDSMVLASVHRHLGYKRDVRRTDTGLSKGNRHRSRRSPKKWRGHLKRHGKKYVAAAAAATVGGAAVGLLAAKVAAKPQCKPHGRRHTCNDSEEDDTEADAKRET